MGKVFEDGFSELQADMVSIALEYVENRAEKIYIYCSFEDGVLTSDVCYKINGKVVHRHKLNDAILNNQPGYDVSIDRQKGLIRIINEDMGGVIKLCKEYQREMPMEIKLVYDVIANKLNADYGYDLYYSNHPTRTSNDVFEEWVKQIKEEEEKVIQEEPQHKKKWFGLFG